VRVSGDWSAQISLYAASAGLNCLYNDDLSWMYAEKYYLPVCLFALL